MIDVAASSDISVAAALVAISFFSFLAGVIFRKWPEKVQEYAESIDGFVLFISPQAHRTLIERCGFALSLMSFAALIAAGFVI
jgi:hypothetical protein